MAEHSIENISDTALWVAYYRAMESDRDDAHFKDPYAKILAGEKGKWIVENMPYGKSSSWWLVVRTKVLDDWILDLTQSKKVDTVLNLAAGLDTRPYRLPLPKELKWIEVDFAPMITYKSRMLEKETPRCNLERIALDLSQAEERRKLFAKIAETSLSVLVITEGLLIYLDEDKVVGLAKDLFAVPQFKYWLQDFSTPESLKFVQKRWGKVLKKGNSEMKFGAEGGPLFYTRFGWKVKDVKYGMEEARKLHREMPFAKFFRFIGQFSKDREMYRTMTGFALLSK